MDTFRIQEKQTFLEDGFEQMTSFQDGHNVSVIYFWQLLISIRIKIT